MAEPGRIKSGSNIKARRIASKCRAVGTGGQGANAPAPPPDFGRSVNPIPTRDRACHALHIITPPPRIFRPSLGPGEATTALHHACFIVVTIATIPKSLPWSRYAVTTMYYLYYSSAPI